MLDEPTATAAPAVCPHCAAEAMRDALKALGLAKPLIDQFEAMLPADAIPLMRQLIAAEPTVIRRLNTAGLSLSEVAPDAD